MLPLRHVSVEAFLVSAQFLVPANQVVVRQHAAGRKTKNTNRRNTEAADKRPYMTSVKPKIPRTSKAYSKVSQYVQYVYIQCPRDDYSLLFAI